MRLNNNYQYYSEGRKFKIYCTCFSEPIEIYLTADSLDDAYVIALTRMSRELKMKKEFIHNRITKHPKSFKILEYVE